MEYERIRDFIISYTVDRTDALSAIRSKAEAEEVPIIRRDTEDFLRTILRMQSPEKILEIGTAVGYSALVMHDELPGCIIDTCELDEKRAGVARQNIEECGLSESIRVHLGDAAELLESFDSVHDLIFIDAAKAQYMIYLKQCIRLSHPGTVIITDNIFEDGKVLESHFLVEKRDRTVHDKMREFLKNIKNDERLSTVLLSVGDGMSVSIVN